MNRLAVARCAVAAILFGASAPAASGLAERMDAFTLAGLLYVGAALAVAPASVRHRPSGAALRASAPRLAVAVVAGGAVGPVLLAVGLARAPAATVSLLLNLEVVATVTIAALFLREQIGRRVVAGTVLVVAASATLASTTAPDLRLGALAVAGAAVCWGIDNSVTASLDRVAPHHITLAKGLVAGTANLLIGSLVVGQFADRSVSGGDVAKALVIGALCYGVSITLWIAGARDLGAARGQLIFATAPFVGAVGAWTVLGDPVGVRQVVALVIAGIGVAAVAGSEHGHRHLHAVRIHDHEHQHDDLHHEHHDRAGLVERHRHEHEHWAVEHEHPHLPDVHHRHEH